MVIGGVAGVLTLTMLPAGLSPFLTVLISVLSAMRMAATVLKRRLGTGELPPAQAVERVEQFEGHLTRLADSAKRLRHWDLPAQDSAQPLAAVAAQAAQLARPLLAMRGTDLQAPGPLPETPVAAHTTLCLLLGALYHLAETGSPPPARITLQAVQGRSGLRVQADGQADAGLAAFASQPVPPLDAAALLCLARHGGAHVQCGAGWVELDAAPARPDVTP